MKTLPRYSLIAAALIGAVAVTGSVTRLAAQSVGEKVTATADEVKKDVQDTGKSAASKLEHLWQQVDAQRLKNRTPDEIVAWLIVGLAVGNLIGRFTNLSWSVNLIFGLLGSFLGGIVAHLTQIDLGLGPILIRYEDLLFALVGATLVLLVMRRVMAGKKPKP